MFGTGAAALSRQCVQAKELLQYESERHSEFISQCAVQGTLLAFELHSKRMSYLSGCAGLSPRSRATLGLHRRG